MSASKAITFVVTGQDEAQARGAARGAAGPALPAGFERGRTTQSVRVSSQRAAGGQVRVSAVPGQDAVVFHVSNGPALVLHPESARDLMLAQSGKDLNRGARAGEPQLTDEVAVPSQLQWRQLGDTAATRGATRGLGDVVLSLVEVITGPAAGLVAKEVVKRVDDQVDEGVYALQAEALPELKGARALPRIPASPGGKPILVFVHGTFSNTKGTFDKLWTRHPQRVRKLFAAYADRVYALDHRTLGVSPIANALTLARALPKRTPVHLVTHSRGGLVAEVLARACGRPALSAQELKLFAGAEYSEHRRDLQELVKALQDVQLQRVVRVACPARGTLLASKRLDAYLSVFKWTLELAGVPVAPALVDFLAEVAQRRTEPETIPGLEAQIPGSPLVQWLHAVDDMIPGDLRVVAGDIAGDSVVSWLKTLLADSFYRTDNDLVVQTSSMYGGAPRKDGASFVFDQGGKVSHFNYFANERSAEAIVDALLKDEPSGYRTIGPLSWKGEDATGYRAARRDDTPASARPAVFVLPGILGSNLKADGKRIWLAFRLLNGLKRLEYKSGGRDGVQPDGPISSVYDRLGEFLSETHEVIEFAFDWRRPIEEEGQRLADAVQAALDARERSNQPVRLIAHSMGGLVARAMQLERPEVWKRMMAQEGARVLMLGTPNGGSWAPMQVLSGDDSFGNMLVDIGAPFQDQQARRLMAQMPGFIQLQAKLDDPASGLSQTETWQRLADEDLKVVREHNFWHNDAMLHECIWGVPAQPVLDQALALRKRLDAQAKASELAPSPSKVVMVLGKADFTPDGYELGPDGLLYLNAQEAGDGRVTLENALLPGVRAWKLDCEHGSLPSEKDAYAAYLELLERGTTQKLAPLDAQAAARGAAMPAAPVHVRSRRSRVPRIARPPQAPREVFAAFEAEAREAARPALGAALQVTVLNGDLSFIRPPLIVGHYRSERLTGTEWVMDRLIGGKMQESLTLGRYPSQPGSHQVFVNTRAAPDNPRQLPRPEAVVVVGLGEEGKLRASELAETVRQGAMAWAQQIAEKPVNMPPQFELAATLIGSGGPGISPGQSAQLVAQGVRDANARLAMLEGKWPTVSHLYLVELYLDRASEALRALQVQEATSPAFFSVSDTVQQGSGALRRPLDSGYRGASYDFISAVTHKEEGQEELIQYTLDTRRAGTEVRSQQAQGRLLRELVRASSREAASDPVIGRTLFKLLIPVDLEAFLGGTAEMVIELDRGTAGIPWELLEARANGGGDERPWAIRAKLLRKLRLDDFRPQVISASKDASVLVIGEPKCSDDYPRLPGARREANAVVKRLTTGAFPASRIRQLIAPEDERKSGATGREVIEALLAEDWRVVHISGHGEAPREIGSEGTAKGETAQKYVPPHGVVLSDDIFLGPREIRAMRKVPELVFVNCCYLAAEDPKGVMNYSRPRFAATVAEELIKIGVRCVIAAGWAVDDEAAEIFATKFYESLLLGERFMDAVAVAREAARACGGNTWAAYQCYGDPNWSFELEGRDAQAPPTPLGQEFAAVTSAPALTLALETIATKSKGPFKQPGENQRQQEKLRYLEALYEGLWGGIGSVAEAFALAWTASGDRARGIDWYERAVSANDGSASIKAAEQLDNLRVRLAGENVEAARKALAEAEEALAEAPRGSAGARARASAQRRLAAARSALPSVARRSEREARKAIESLKKLAAAQPTMERASLCGSAYKRLAMIQAARGVSDRAALAGMQRHYAEAEKLGREAGLPDLFYPALNRIAAELTLGGTRRGSGLAQAEVDLVRQSIAARLRDDPDFWSAAGNTELHIYEALAKGRLAPARAAIEREFEDLHSRVGAKWMWASVRDQAQFVLRRYAGRSKAPAERSAVEALLKRLESYS